MSSKIHYIAIILTIISASTLYAADTASDSAEVATPYQAVVIGKSVDIYPRPSAKEYSCGKVNSPETLTVVSVLGNWAKIIPPTGCFSWISKDYVKKDESGLNIGMVTGNSVRVWAGAEGLSPLHSPKQQTSLNEGEHVALLGVEKEGYYKIVPPIGAYLWIGTENIKYLDAVKTTPIKPSEFKPIPLPDTEPAETPIRTTTETATAEPVTFDAPPVFAPAAEPAAAPEPEVISEPKPTSSQQQKLDLCYAIMAKIEAEKEKPIEQQDYSEIEQQIIPLMEDKTAGKAQRYAEYQMGMVERFKLAGTAQQELQQQDQQLAERLEQIKEKYEKKASIVPLSARYTISGTLKKSQIYTAANSQQRFLIIDKSGKILSYALPNNDYVKEAALSLVGKKVGIKGVITKDPDNSVTVIDFTEIEDITEE